MESGLNTITRKSDDSSVTVPYEMTFGDAKTLKADNSSYDRCGWPHHLLVPKGSAEGLPAQMFVMISDYETDKVSTVLPVYSWVRLKPQTKFIFILYYLKFDSQAHIINKVTHNCINYVK